MVIYFLSVEDILEIHADQIKRYGGRLGVRDQNLLESAIAQPSTRFNGQYLYKSLHDKAAVYLFHICQNHPFIDGNKRVALVSMLVFLDLNGESMDYGEKDLENLTLAVATGKMTKENIVKFLIKNEIPARTPVMKDRK